jgi:2-dehydro-3-deoxyphosphooctonate aldolase (KDO 8-P synthase)
MESEKFVRNIARDLAGVCRELGVPFIFKASYDKANRSSVQSFRGIGIEAGCQLLAEVRETTGRPVTTDVHSAEEAKTAGRYVDLLQIPAFLCRQTDLLRAAAETGRPVNVKKGQFLAPWDVENIAAKLEAFGCREYVFTERGPVSAIKISWRTCVRSIGSVSRVTRWYSTRLTLCSVRAPPAIGAAEMASWRPS